MIEKFSYYKYLFGITIKEVKEKKIRFTSFYR